MYRISCFVSKLIFLSIVSCVRGQDSCVFQQPHNSLRSIPDDDGSLRILGPAGWFPKDLSKVSLEFSIPLQRNIDYVIVESKYAVQEKFQYPSQHSSSLLLNLIPGKFWSLNLLENTSSIPLKLVNAYCGHTPAESKFVAVQVGTLIRRRGRCPHIPELPGCSKQLQNLITSVLSYCQHPKIIQSKLLDWKQYHSTFLLRLNPPLIFINGGDQDMHSAARSVDSFIAAHAVLDIVWEPYDPLEPHWWILMPRPTGLPGTLFAMFDSIQWRHPLVADAERLRNQPPCNASSVGCIPGCPDTYVMGITASGYCADANNLLGHFRMATIDGRPFQASPVRLGYRYTAPLWGGTDGWYTLTDALIYV